MTIAFLNTLSVVRDLNFKKSSYANMLYLFRLTHGISVNLSLKIWEECALYPKWGQLWKTEIKPQNSKSSLKYKWHCNAIYRKLDNNRRKSL